MSSSQLMSTAPTPIHPLYSRSELESIFLPVKQMLQIDRVLTINEGRVVCEMDITRHWVFPMHFPSDPIFPGSLLIEAAGQVVAICAWHAGLRGRPRMVKVEAKFESPVVPQDQAVTLTATVRLRKNICMGNVNLFVVERKVAEIKPVIIVTSHHNSNS